MGSPTRASLTRTRLLLLLLGAALTTGTAGALTYRYMSDPTRVAERFLQACRAHDYGALYSMMDRSFRQAVPLERGRVLFAALNTAVPRDWSIVLTGHPSVPTGLEAWDLYHVRVEAKGAGTDLESPKAFMVVLTQGKDRRWRVAFMPTYESLYFALPTRVQVPDLQQVIAWAAGAQAPSLEHCGEQE